MTGSDWTGHAGPVTRSIAYVLDAIIVSVLATGAVVAVGLVAAAIGSQARDLARAVVSAYVLTQPT
jgi:hypothetical protein